MKKEKACKIVFSDIDGTLLTSDGDHGGDEGDDPES